jgi:hypothetical protein
MNGTDSGMCPMVGFGISVTECLRTAIMEL